MCVSEGEKEAKAGPPGDDEEAGGVHTGAGGDMEDGGGHASPEDFGGEPQGDWDGEEMGGHCGYDYSDGWGYAGDSPNLLPLIPTVSTAWCTAWTAQA